MRFKFPHFFLFFPDSFQLFCRALINGFFVGGGGNLLCFRPPPPAAAVLFLRGLERQQYIALVTADGE
jgi:hypothetical protein